MLHKLTIGRYLFFHKHRRANLDGYANIYSIESIFLLKGNSAIQFNYWNDDSKNIKGFRENGGFDYIPWEGFLGDKYNSYTHFTRNVEVTSTKNVYEKTVMKRKKKGFQRRI